MTDLTDCLSFALFANLQRDFTALTTSENLISYARKIEHIFVKRFGAKLAKVYFTRDSINYAFDPFVGQTFDKRNIDLRQSETRYFFELGNRQHNLILIVEFPSTPSNIVDAIIY